MSFALPNPPLDSQATFRILLEAMASPGAVLPLPCVAAGVSTLSASVVQVLLTLADHETTVWMAPPLATEDALRFLRLGPGSPLAPNPAEATFAVVALDAPFPLLREFAQGSALYPDQSTTLLLCCRHLSTPSGGSGRVVLRGPGIPATQEVQGGRAFHAQGASKDFWQQVAVNHGQYPLGVDLIFVSPDAVAALPRSTAVEWLD
ncbi:MAG: phosphonate C-P lyase system protein PhnH [Bryobacterales bacterium]|jgi:alpha-D-ribose 1-methylphosphonate 5-triphosphate synthase subunit PhnH|nr:phosphonate C-P lyase system protein PhnH [Bryobacterales bacterium]